VPLYLVGGTVRDLLRSRSVRDLDLVVEGDAAAFARCLSRKLGGTVRSHGRFGTATVLLPQGERLDIAASRRERYERPGVLPLVEPASIAEDLARRDFTINAMAVVLAMRPARLLDPFGGRRDLARGKIRMLHPRSPFDDPTRAFRAARYANRLRFSIDGATRRFIAGAIRGGAFGAVSGDRLRRELALLFTEPDRAGSVKLLERLGLLRVLHPSLPADRSALRRLRTAERLASRGEGGWLLYLLAWTAGLSRSVLVALADRLSVAGAERRLLLSWPEILRSLERGLARDRRSALRRRMGGLPREALLAAAASLPADRRRVLLALADAGPIALSIGGRDLVAAGVAPGPAIGRALARTLAARQDGSIPREGELAYALEVAQSS
jgi:tRNA nucleotidyltransferase (CCA-adding enzyme)